MNYNIVAFAYPDLTPDGQVKFVSIIKTSSKHQWVKQNVVDTCNEIFISL